MKKIYAVFCLLFAGFSFAFATGSSDSSKTIVMGALIRNLNETFVRDYADNLKKLARENNVQLKLLDGNGDVATQLDQLKTLLSQGVKYFVIIPQDTGATEQMAQLIKAKDGAAAFSNIQPSVAALKTSTNFYFASSPETVAGEYQAKIIDDYFKKYPAKAPNKIINMILINGQLGHPAQVNRRRGVINGLKSRGWQVNIVVEDTANWGAAEAQAKMDAWLAAFAGKFNVVVAQNDDMALGAIESMLINKYTDNPNDVTKDVDGDGTVLRVPVLGIDATETGRRSMAESKMYATVLQDSVGQSTTAFELVYQCAVNGTAIGYTTRSGLAAATRVTDEEPVTDAAVLAQCFLVPFKPVTR
ncbi:MAG: substrate-binding domain-containing protein [Treponema sp.]|nr:substrate-binding domain-containing protein [Treponema sp.]